MVACPVLHPHPGHAPGQLHQRRQRGLVSHHGGAHHRLLHIPYAESVALHSLAGVDTASPHLCPVDYWSSAVSRQLYTKPGSFPPSGLATRDKLGRRSLPAVVVKIHSGLLGSGQGKADPSMKHSSTFGIALSVFDCVELGPVQHCALVLAPATTFDRERNSMGHSGQ